MNRLLRLIYSNKFFAFIMLIFQVFMIVLGLVWLSEYIRFLYVATSVLSAVLIIIEVNRDEEPMFKITWILLISIVPIFGALLYIYLHTGIMTKDMAHAQKKVQEAVRPYMKQDETILHDLSAENPNEEGLIKYLSKYGGSPAYKNTAVEYYSLGDDMFKAILEELEKAENFIFLEFFIINQRGRFWPEILSILKRKVKEGVEVRMLYDGMGCMTTLPGDYAEIMEREGIKCKVFSPIQPLLSTYQNNRDHRKILSIDGKTVFCGGVNLADEYANFIKRFGHWKDNGIKLTGEAASGFTAMFLEMWNMSFSDQNEDFAKYIDAAKQYPSQSYGIIVPYGDSPLDKEYVGKQVYIYMINSANRYCHIMTPYLVIDNEILEALKFAAQRGVDVKIIMPHIPDKKTAFWLARTYYPDLIKYGIQIYEYVPGFVHAKTVVSDDRRAVVGTINFDFRSLYLHYECAAYMFDVPAILDIENDYRNTLTSCMRITMNEYRQFPLYTKFMGKIIRLVAPLI